MKKKKINNKKIIKVFGYLCFLLIIILLAISFYTWNNFKSASFEQIYIAVVEAEGSSLDGIKGGIIYTIIFVLIFTLIFIIIPFILNGKLKNKYELDLKFKDKKILKLVIPFKLNKLYFISLSVISIFLIVNNLGITNYIKNKMNTTTLYEDYYVDPKGANLTFPDKKKNLIYIYLESMEVSYANSKNLGEVVSYIPELEEIAIQNINFSNTNDLGGAYTLRNTTWTSAAMIATTSGIPLSVSVGANSYTGYSSFTPGAYSLGEILEDNGYKNYIMFGSLASFGGRQEYFKEHGNYTIYDYEYARDTGLIDKDYKVWWGYEDSKLFTFAKDKLLEISKKDEPFNFTMLTADTHFQDGYLDSMCDSKYDNQYKNVIACSSYMVSSFIEWIQEQEFYKDTIIVLVGDHLTMQYGDFLNNLGSNRTVYNAFLNTNLSQENTKNRLFSTMDLYPTTLASLGVKIEGERLGLGTNLFSDKKTLIEELGLDYLNQEIPKHSRYYNSNILKSTYFEMLS